MTKREFLEMVIDGTMNDEMVTFAKSEIEKMNARNAKRAATPSKRARENEPIKAKIIELLEENSSVTMTASEIAEAVGITTQKASALLRQIDGLTVSEVKIKGKGKVKGYTVA